MTNDNYEHPIGEVVTYSARIASTGTDTNIAMAPWQSGVGGKLILKKIHIGGAATASRITIFDKDTNDAVTPGTNGTTTAPLLAINTGAATDGGLGYNECPNIMFQAGICCQVTVANVDITVECLRIVSA